MFSTKRITIAITIAIISLSVGRLSVNAENQSLEINGSPNYNGYTTYTNSQYGFSIEYPDSFEQKTASIENNYVTEILPNSEEGIDLVSPSWDVELIAWGYERAGIKITDIYNLELSRHPGAAYKVLKNDWFVISWIDSTTSIEKPMIVYLKSVVGTRFCTSLKLIYPQNMKTRYDPMVKRIINGFKTPN